MRSYAPPSFLEAEADGYRCADVEIERESTLRAPWHDDPSLYQSVRDEILRVLGEPGRSIEARLLTLAHAAESVSGYFHEHAEDVDSRRLLRDFRSARLRSVRMTPAEDATVGTLARYFLEDIDPVRLGPFARLVQAIRREYQGSSFDGSEGAGRTEGEVLALCEMALGEVDFPVSMKPAARLDRAGLLRRYRGLRARLHHVHSERVDQFLSELSINHVLGSDYRVFPDLRHYVGEILVRVAVARFLLVSHPDLSLSVGAFGPDSAEVEGELGSTRALERAVRETLRFLQNVGDALMRDLRRVLGFSGDAAPNLGTLRALAGT